jgi:hypothetical protein
MSQDRAARSVSAHGDLPATRSAADRKESLRMKNPITAFATNPSIHASGRTVNTVDSRESASPVSDKRAGRAAKPPATSREPARFRGSDRKETKETRPDGRHLGAVLPCRRSFGSRITVGSNPAMEHGDPAALEIQLRHQIAKLMDWYRRRLRSELARRAWQRRLRTGDCTQTRSGAQSVI